MSEVAVITGGASGLGLALGDRCAAHGMAVVLLDLDGERARSEAEALAFTYGVEAAGMRVDVGDAGGVDRAAHAVEDRFGRADLVVSNVGVQLFGSAESLTDDEWRWVLDVNVIGSARVARAFLPLLRSSPRRRLAFTTSSSVLDPSSRLAVYQASKFAVWGLAETLRLELADDGIGVSVIFPSGMITRHLETSEAAQPDHRRRPARRRALRHHPRRPRDRGGTTSRRAARRRRSRPGRLGPYVVGRPAWNRSAFAVEGPSAAARSSIAPASSAATSGSGR